MTRWRYWQATDLRFTGRGFESWLGTITLHYIKTLYGGLSKSNFKDHYGDATIGQCLGMIAEINVFSHWTS